MTEAEHTHTDSALGRYRALLEVSEAIAAHRDLPALFHELAQRLPGIVRFDFLSLVLHEPARNVMRLHILESRASSSSASGSSAPGPTSAGSELPVDQSPGGRVWETQAPLVISNVDEEARFPQAVQMMRGHNIRSVCMVPLTTAMRPLGAMGVGSTHAHQDRKSTRLNSSHGYISYAVFCLKKKKKQKHERNNKHITPQRMVPTVTPVTRITAATLEDCRAVNLGALMIPRIRSKYVELRPGM